QCLQRHQRPHLCWREPILQRNDQPLDGEHPYVTVTPGDRLGDGATLALLTQPINAGEQVHVTVVCP
ncbi:MAG TPA: hypothetical protein VFS20_04305, partial [Longimicrobium sp.]|nr:hypothetical protein [Longimicrobium sp.]